MEKPDCQPCKFLGFLHYNRGQSPQPIQHSAAQGARVLPLEAVAIEAFFVSTKEITVYSHKSMTFQLITQFLTENPNFALGFEAGIIYNKMRTGMREIEGQYNIANQDQLFVMAGNLGYAVKEWTKLDETWMFCKFTKT